MMEEMVREAQMVKEVKGMEVTRVGATVRAAVTVVQTVAGSALCAFRYILYNISLYMN